MDVLISANQAVLDFARNVPKNFSSNMSEDEFKKWLEMTDKAGVNEERIQEITV